MSRGVTPSAVQRRGDFFDRGQFRQGHQAAFAFRHFRGRAGRHGGLAVAAERSRLRNIERGSHVDGDIAVGNGAAGNADGRRGDDGAGAFVDDDARRRVGRDFEALQPRDEIHRDGLARFGDADADGGGIHGVGAELVKHWLMAAAMRAAEVKLGFAQQQFDRVVPDDGGREFRVPPGRRR